MRVQQIGENNRENNDFLMRLHVPQKTADFGNKESLESAHMKNFTVRHHRPPVLSTLYHQAPARNRLKLRVQQEVRLWT